MNTAAKGRRNEHRSMRIFESQGFDVLRAAASKGAWDFVAVGEVFVICVQVKSSKWPGRAEMAALAEKRYPPHVLRQVHRWRPRARKPDVRTWTGTEWVTE